MLGDGVFHCYHIKVPKRGKSTPTFRTEVYAKDYPWRIWVLIDTPHPTCHNRRLSDSLLAHNTYSSSSICYEMASSIYTTENNIVTSPRRGLGVIVLTVYVCLYVCLCVCVSVCSANILVFYFSAIRRDIDLKCIHDTYRVVLNSLKIYLHRSTINVTGTAHCFLKVQSYHKN